MIVGGCSISSICSSIWAWQAHLLQWTVANRSWLWLQVQHHLLWVWADASPNAQLECLAKQPAVVDELQQEDKVIYMHPW